MNPTVIEQWVEKFKSLPRWVQIITALGVGFIVILAIAVNLNTQPEHAPAWQVMLDATLKLIIVILFIYVCAALFKRWRGNISPGRVRQLRVVESIQLTPRRALHVVSVGEQTFLIGATDQAISLISPITSETNEMNPAAAAGSGEFASILHDRTAEMEEDQ